MLLFTDRAQLPDGRSLVHQVQRAVDGGPLVVVLRERDLEDHERARLADALVDLLEPVGGLLVSARPMIEGSHGVHLRRDDPVVRDRSGLVGRSCHDADELTRARDERADYVTLSPVAPSASKPGYGPALGSTGLSALLAQVPGAPAAYALGGVEPSNAAQWRACGAYGVASMGAVMRASDPGAVVRRLAAPV